MSTIAKEVHDFVARNFDSVEAIEIAVMLQRSPNTFWGAAAVSQRLGIAEEVAGNKMATLRGAGLFEPAEQSNAYRFAPKDPRDAALMASVAELYAERRIGVINIVYSANLEKLRTFSSAFKLKGT